MKKACTAILAAAICVAALHAGAFEPETVEQKLFRPDRGSGCIGPCCAENCGGGGSHFQSHWNSVRISGNIERGSEIHGILLFNIDEPISKGLTFPVNHPFLSASNPF